MVLTQKPDLAKKILQMKGQGQDFERRYWFSILGYNYRLTNLQAAIGLAQVERISRHLEARRHVAEAYRRLLSPCAGLVLPVERPWARHAWWMFGVLLREGAAPGRDGVMRRLAEQGIETRPFFYPLSSLPVYAELKQQGRCPVAASVASRGICLPTWSGLTSAQVEEVAAGLQAALNHA